MRPPFPHVLDSTMIADFRSCPQRFARTHLQHWKPKSLSIHLHAGACFAKGLEVARFAYFHNGTPPDEAVALGCRELLAAWGDFPVPEGSNKALDRMLGALVFYFDSYPLATDKATPHIMPSGRPAIEFSFAEPLSAVHPDTGDPLIYCGRSDQIVDFAGGLYIEDDKTASQLGASWSRQWDLRSQFTGYCWAARRAGLAVTGVLVRGVSILKTKYDTLEAITYRSQWEVDRWYDQLLRDIHRMQMCWHEGYWDYALDHACTEYSGCSFASICKSPEPDPWLEMYFERRKWDPLERTETLLEADQW